jgi:hypothetical protein
MADSLSNVHFAGRLGTYKYYNMDQVVAQALTLFEKLRGRRATEPIEHTKTVMTMRRSVEGEGNSTTLDQDEDSEAAA